MWSLPQPHKVNPQSTLKTRALNNAGDGDIPVLGKVGFGQFLYKEEEKISMKQNRI